MRISCWHGTPSSLSSSENSSILINCWLGEITSFSGSIQRSCSSSWAYYGNHWIQWWCLIFDLQMDWINLTIRTHKRLFYRTHPLRMYQVSPWRQNLTSCRRRRSPWAHKPPCLSSSYIATASYFYTCSYTSARDEIPYEIVVRWEPCRNHADTFLVSPSCDRTTSTLTTICLRRTTFSLWYAHKFHFEHLRTYLYIDLQTF